MKTEGEDDPSSKAELTEVADCLADCEAFWKLELLNKQHSEESANSRSTVPDKEMKEGSLSSTPIVLDADLMERALSSRANVLNIDAGIKDKGTNNARFNQALNSEKQSGLSYYQKSLLDRQRWKETNPTVISPPSLAEQFANWTVISPPSDEQLARFEGIGRGMVLTGSSSEEVLSQFGRFQEDLERCQEVISTPAIPPAHAGNTAENYLYDLVIKTMVLGSLSYDEAMIHVELYKRFAEGAVPSSYTQTNASIPQNAEGIGQIAELNQLEHQIQCSKRSQAHQEGPVEEIKSLQIDMLAINEAIRKAKDVQDRQQKLIKQYKSNRHLSHFR